MTLASWQVGICKSLGDDRETRGQLPVAAKKGNHRAVTASGIEEPHPRRLATTDTDVPSLPQGHLVDDWSRPPLRGHEGAHAIAASSFVAAAARIE
jgi:hypothetical protein